MKTLINLGKTCNNSSNFCELISLVFSRAVQYGYNASAGKYYYFVHIPGRSLFVNL